MIQASVRYYRRLHSKQAFAQGEARVRAGRTAQAAEAFDLAGALSDDDDLRRRSIEAAADAYDRLGRGAEAAERLEALLAFDAGELKVRRRLAAILVALDRPADAARQLELLAAATPHDISLWESLAQARAAVGDGAGELAAWLGAIKAAPDNAKFRIKVIRLLTADGRLKEAAHHRLRLAQIEPGKTETWRVAARLLKDVGETEAAAEAWRSLLMADGADVEAHRALAAHHRDLGQTAEAIPHLRFEAEQVGGRKAAVRLALSCEQIGDDGGAEAAWSRVLAIEPGRTDAIERLVALRRKRGDLAGAVTVLQSAVDADPSSVEAQRALAALVKESGDREATLRAWSRLVEMAPDSTDARLQLGMYLFDLGRRAEAAAHLAVAAAHSPNDAKLWRRLAWCRRGEEELDGEAEALRQLLVIDDADDEAKTRLIEVLMEAGRRGEAEPLLAELARQRPDDIRLPVHLARARRDIGDEAGALEAWRQVLAINPAEPDANQNIGESLLAAGDLAGAADHLAAAAPAAPKPAPAWSRVVQLRRDIGDADGEILALQRLAEVAATFHLKSHQRLIALLTAAGRLAETEPSLLRMIESHPGLALYKQLARARQASGDRVGEVEALRRALEIAPGDFEAGGRMAKHLLWAGETAAATAILRSMGRKSLPSLWTMAARAYEKTRDIDDEIDAWRQVLALRKDEAPEVLAAHARLAELLVGIGESAGAIIHLEFCATRAPDDHWLRERLAGALYVAGRRAEAAKHLALVAKARPTQARPWKRYARMIEELGKRRVALSAWRHVARLAADDAEAQAAIERLRNP